MSETAKDVHNGGAMTEENEKLQGIGGWLILLAIGLVMSPVRIIILIYQTYSDIFTTGSWEMLTTPGNDAYHPLWKPILSSELAINFAIIIFSIVLIYVFFSKKKIFPKLFVAFALFSFFFIIADSYAVTLVLPDEQMFDEETIKELSRSLTAIVVWVPYLYISRRAKNTFIN